MAEASIRSAGNGGFMTINQRKEKHNVNDTYKRLLDEARAMDPDGDRTPQVKEYRQKAETGLSNPPPAPSR
jgi:hypothetical protein